MWMIAARALAGVAAFLRGLAKNAEQLSRWRTWRAILSRAFGARGAEEAAAEADATQTRKIADSLNVTSANCRF